MVTLCCGKPDKFCAAGQLAGEDLTCFFSYFSFSMRRRGDTPAMICYLTPFFATWYTNCYLKVLLNYKKKKNILSLQCVTVNDTGPEKEKKRILLLIIYSLWQKGLKSQLVNVLPITSLLFHLPFYFDYIISEYHNSLHYLTWNRFQKLHNTLVIKSFHTLNKRENIKRNSVWSLYPKTQREIHISSTVSQ